MTSAIFSDLRYPTILKCFVSFGGRRFVTCVFSLQPLWVLLVPAAALQSAPFCSQRAAARPSAGLCRAHLVRRGFHFLPFLPEG